MIYTKLDIFVFIQSYARFSPEKRRDCVGSGLVGRKKFFVRIRLLIGQH